MSTTPAAHLARLKVTYQGWHLSRTADGFAAVERWTGRTITAVACHEHGLWREFCDRVTVGDG